MKICVQLYVSPTRKGKITSGIHTPPNLDPGLVEVSVSFAIDFISANLRLRHNSISRRSPVAHTKAFFEELLSQKEAR